MSGNGIWARRPVAWAVPIVVAGGVAVGTVLSSTSASGASPQLPPRTPAQLLTAVQTSAATAFSGTVREGADLGFPSLPDSSSAASLSWQSFLTGAHTARVWADGPDRQRIALLGQLSEADVIHNGRDVWTYTSDTNTASHTVLPARAGQANAPNALASTPAAVSAQIVQAISPSTALSVDRSRMVAGRAAYTLVLRPRDSRSTVREVTIAIDAHRWVPLQVQIFGAGSAPAFQTGFSSISFRTPASSTFAFHAPASAKVTTNPLTARQHGRFPAQREHIVPPTQDLPTVRGPATPAPDAGVAPKLIGTGWTSVLELSDGQLHPELNLLNHLTSVAGTSGDQLLHTALVNAIFTPDGRAFVGAVSPALLEHVAATN